MGIFCSTYDTEDTEDIQFKKAIEESMWSEHVRKHNERQLNHILKVSKETPKKNQYQEEKIHSDDYSGNESDEY